VFESIPECEKPPVPPPEYSIRDRLVFRAPRARLDQSAQSARAGVLEWDVEFDLSALEKFQRPFAIVAPGECLDVTQEREPVRPYAPGVDPGRITDPRVRAAARVAASGIREGQTPGEAYRVELDRERRIEAARAGREARAETSRGPGPRGAVVVDPPPDAPTTSLPGWPPDPGRPGPSDRPELPTVVCDSPHCEWFVLTGDRTLETFARATLRVTADLVVGFVPGGKPWLPELALAIAKPPDGMPAVRVEVTSVETLGVLANVNRDLIASKLESVVSAWAAAAWAGLINEPVVFARQVLDRDVLVNLADLRGLFDGGPRRAATCMNAAPVGQFSRDVIVGAAEELSDLVGFRQENGDTERGAYGIEQGLAAWPVRWVDGLTPRLP
jgi:hypothetical protein